MKIDDLSGLLPSIYYSQDRSWAKPNEILVLGPQKFWKKLHRKNLQNFLFKLPNLPKKNFYLEFFKNRLHSPKSQDRSLLQLTHLFTTLCSGMYGQNV